MLKILFILASVFYSMDAMPIDRVLMERYELATLDESGKHGCITQKDERICQSFNLSFIHTKKLAKDYKALAKRLDAIFSKEQEEFNAIDVDKNLKEEEFGCWGHHIDRSYRLYGINSKFLTLEYVEDSYECGAHGSYSIDYRLFDMKSGKELNISDILKPHSMAQLKSITKAYYYKIRGLKKGASLKELGWFENKFVLPGAIALSDRGLVMHYNSYEVQPYAAGQEEFVVPFKLLRPLLKESYFTKEFLAELERLKHTYYKRFDDDIVVDGHYNEGILHLVVLAKNPTKKAMQGWLSIGFRELISRGSRAAIKNSGFDTALNYPAGTKIYNKEQKKALKSHYLLVEGYAKRWEQGKSKIMELEVPLAKSMPHLELLIRTNFKSPKSSFELEQKNCNSLLFKGQQGYMNYKMSLDF